MQNRKGKIQRDANGQIIELDLRGTDVNDADLKTLKELANLQTLYLGGTEITDVGLAELKEMKSLRFLGLVGAKVTVVGLNAIRAALPDCQLASGGR